MGVEEEWDEEGGGRGGGGIQREGSREREGKRNREREGKRNRERVEEGEEEVTDWLQNHKNVSPTN